MDILSHLKVESPANNSDGILLEITSMCAHRGVDID